MADEKVTAPDESGNDDAELSKAWDATETVETKEVKTDSEVKDNESADEVSPETAETETPDDKVDPKQKHKERSDLGRKFKDFQTEVSSFQQKILDELKALKEGKTVTTAEPEIELPEVITTAEDVDKVMTARERQKEKERLSYQKAYLDTISNVSQTDELKDEIWAEMTANNYQNEFNKVHTGKADIDAQLNYERAKSAVLKKRLESGNTKLPERKTAEKTPIQPAGTGTVAKSAPATLPKLSPEVQNYANYLISQGMSEAEVAEALKD